MANRIQRGRTTSTDDHRVNPDGGQAGLPDSGRVLRPRNWSPVRAVTRRLNSDGTPPSENPAGPRRSATVDCGLYLDGRRQAGDWDYAKALAAARRAETGFVWLGLHEPDLTEMTEIAATYGLHELAVEDAVKAQQRPKLERFGEVSFLVLRTARYCEHAELTENSDVVETGQVMLFIGPQFLISVRHGDACRLAPVREELETRQELLLHGPWAVAYAITDRVVDLYLEVADRLEDDMDVLETEVFDRQSSGRIQRIYQMKRELVEFKRAVMPLQRPLLALATQMNRDVPKEVRRYFRDVQDHLSRTVEQVNSYDDLLNSILQARLAQVTVDQNNDMRKIAAWAAIAAVWTAIAGIYGMNFDFMPELKMTYGYPVVLALMLTISLTLYRWFRRNDWL
ncbi:magnesium transport protein CorA [Micromonospora qiuiae]|uniref:Magnesium transport protein CorA n=1 Tax=Micromonospora qiuiae TaxID=502268 RepID=A0ABQ4JHS6_9ACTN|nr:magnesium transport protein CorA [Micromonospora qiuiae]